MSFFEDASLVLIPSAQKTSKVYSVKPTDGTGDLAFTRTGDTASRINSAGLIEKVRTNLYPRGSALLATGWTSVGATLTAGQTDPNGGTTALRVQLAASQAPYAYIYQTFTGSAATYARSAYIKAASAQSIRIVDPYSGAGTTVNLTTDWQRFTAVGDGIAPDFGIQFDNNNDDAAKDFTIAFVQIETGDIATDYIPTTTASVSVGPVANVPRLDYLNSSCPRLLLEPQRTNLLQYSEQFNNAYWEVGSAASVSANTSETLDPAGYYGADKLTANGSGAIFVRRNVYLGTAQTCSNSIFAKKANHRYVGFRNSGTTSQHDVFDFDTKTWTNNSGATLSYDELGNGWFRLKSVNTDAVNLNYYWSVLPAVTTEGVEVTTASNLSVYIWGGQAEQNASYVTSYAPSLGAAVTRGADACSKTGISSLIGQTEGTLFVEVDIIAGTPVYHTLMQVYGDIDNRIAIGQDLNSTDVFMYINDSGTASYQVTTTPAGHYKIALAYKSGDVAMYINGVPAITSSRSISFGTALTTLFLNNVNGNEIGIFKDSQALLFKTRLTNAQLAELTTL